METSTDVRHKLQSLNAKFSSVVDQFAKSYQPLLNKDVYSLQKAMVSELQYDPHLETGLTFRQLFSHIEMRNHLDIFNTTLLRGLLKVRKNTIAELSFSNYESHEEEFIRSTRVIDFASVVGNTVEMPSRRGFAVVEMTFAHSMEQWPNKTLKEMHSFLKYVYKEYSWFPTRLQVTQSASSEVEYVQDRKGASQRTNQKHAHFLLEKGCIVSIAGEPVQNVSVSTHVSTVACTCVWCVCVCVLCVLGTASQPGPWDQLWIYYNLP